MTESPRGEFGSNMGSENIESQQISPEEREILEVNTTRIAEALKESEKVIEQIDAAISGDADGKVSAEAQAVRQELIAIREQTRTLRGKFAEGTYMFLGLALLGAAALGVRDLGLKLDTPDFSKRNEAREELKEKGITKEQQWAYIPGLNNLIYKAIIPAGYIIPNPEEVIKNLFERNEGIPEREDAWRLYLGLPQKSNTFGISLYKPQNSKDDIYYYKINGFFDKYVHQGDYQITMDGPNMERIEKGDDEDAKKKLSDVIKNLIEQMKLQGQDKMIEEDSAASVMGDFKFSKGQDEKGYYISYYDKWKLDIGPEKNGGFFGKPFEIYDRVYYNPETFEPINIPDSKN